MANWKLPTLADLEPSEPFFARSAPSSPPDQHQEEPTYRCECGALNVPGDMMFDVRRLPPVLRGRAGIAKDTAFLCDGCLATIFREGRLGHDEFYGALRAPEAHLKEVRAFMRSYPYPLDSRGHARKLKHHRDLRASTK